MTPASRWCNKIELPVEGLMSDNLYMWRLLHFTEQCLIGFESGPGESTFTSAEFAVTLCRLCGTQINS